MLVFLNHLVTCCLSIGTDQKITAFPNFTMQFVHVGFESQFSDSDFAIGV
jgi:hypothetical protein